MERLAPHLDEVYLDVRQLLFDVDEDIEHVFFPLSGVMSMIAVGADGSGVEVATIGNEGMVGLPAALGTRRTNLQAFSQVAGAALRLSTDRLSAELANGGALRRIIDLYTQALFAQVAQASACNRLHSVDERCARWLLMTQDRAGDEFDLAHQFLAQMLGVRRATVTEVMSRLRRRGIVRYERGSLRIVDRAALEGVSCECYALIRSEYDRLLGAAGRRRIPKTARANVSRAGLSTARAPSRAS